MLLIGGSVVLCVRSLGVVWVTGLGVVLVIMTGAAVVVLTLGFNVVLGVVLRGKRVVRVVGVSGCDVPAGVGTSEM